MRKNALVLCALVIAAAIIAVIILSPKAADEGRDSNEDGWPSQSTGAMISYNPYDMVGSWHKGQMHCHSGGVTDGSMSPENVTAQYADRGYDFIALTDHNAITQVRGSILVLGQEYGKGSTESTADTHMNGYNLSFVPDMYSSDQQRVDNITAQDGIVTLNHPLDGSFAYDNVTLQTLANYTCLEVFNGKRNLTCQGLWDDLLSSGRRAWAVATDDAHTVDQIGKGWIVVRFTGNVSTDKVIEAIKHGSFYASTGPTIQDIVFDGQFFNITTPGAEEIRFYGAGDRLLQTSLGDEASYRVMGNESFVRAEIIADGHTAWTQPVFIEPIPVGAHIEHPLTPSLDAQFLIREE